VSRVRKKNQEWRDLRDKPQSAKREEIEHELAPSLVAAARDLDGAIAPFLILRAFFHP